MSWPVPEPWFAAAAARPLHPALITPEGEVTTWRALADRVARRATALAESGVGVGQRVALLGPARPAWVMECFALLTVGATVVPLPARATPAELTAALRVAAPSFVSAIEAHTLPVASREVLATTGCARVLSPGLGAEPFAPRLVPLEEVRFVVLSSGTTRAPKAVPLQWGQLLFGAMGSALRLGHHLDDVWLACLPLSGVGGLSVLLRCALGAITVALHPRFDAAQVAADLDAGMASLCSLSPAMLAEVLDARAEQPLPPRVRCLLIGGAATPASVVARARRLALPLALTWGMTETGSQAATRSPGDLDPEAGAGAPLAFTQVTTDAEGALVIEGPQAPGGRLRTEDLGAVDAQGRVQVAERRDAVVVSGGLNLSPGEIEAALATHPAVAEVAVVGLPHRRWGARPVAILVLVPSARCAQGIESMDESPRIIEAGLAASLAAAVRGRLSAPKVPDAFVAVKTLPEGLLGKRPLAALRRLALLGLGAEHRAAGLGASDDLEGSEAEAVEAAVEDLGPRDALHARPAHEGVLEPDHGAHVGGVVGAVDRVLKGDGSRAQPRDHGVDHQAIPAVAGAPVLGGGVHQRQAKAHPLGEPAAQVTERDTVHLQALEGPVQELLEGDVGVLEVPPEEHHTGAILLVEAHRESVADHEASSCVGAPGDDRGAASGGDAAGGGAHV